MAWTTPRTWASGYVVLAADLNTHLRDNLNVTAPAVMTTLGDIIYASGANTPARLAKSTTSTQYLANTGTSNAPQWNEVALATGVSGTLPVGNGGTGATSFTANGILVGNTTSAVAVTATMATKGHLMVGDGSGVPSMLPVGGTDDHVLTVDSGERTGVKWAAVAASGAQIAVGTHTGNDASSQAITGIGFQPKYLRINRRYTTAQTGAESKGALLWTSGSIVDDNASGMAITGNDGSQEFWTYTISCIRSLDSDGYTVGDGGTSNHPNANGVVYNYMAIG